MSLIQISFRSVESSRRRLDTARGTYRNMEMRVGLVMAAVFIHPALIDMHVHNILYLNLIAIQMRGVVEDMVARTNRKLVVKRRLTAGYLNGRGPFFTKCSYELVERIVGFAFPDVESA